MTNSDRIILYLVATCLSFLLFSWGVYALAAAKAILSSVFEAGDDEDGEDGDASWHEKKYGVGWWL